MFYRLYSLIMIFFAGIVYGQESWDLQQTWDILLENNLSLEQQNNLKFQTEKELARSRTTLLPQLTASASYRYQSELAKLDLPFPGAPTINAGTKSQYDAAITVSQPIFTGFRNINRIRVAQAQHQIRETSYTMIQQQLMLQSGLLFYDIQQNLLQQRTLEASLRRAENQLQKMKNMQQAGQVTAFDTLETATRRLEILNDLYATQDYHDILKSRLASLINLDSLPDLVQKDLNILGFPERSIREWQNLALEQRPDLQQINQRIKLQTHQVDINRGVTYPQIFANASYHYSRPGINFFVDEWMSYYSAGVQLQWNIWNWKRDVYSIQRAQLEKKRLDMSLSDAVITIKNEVRQMYLMMQTAYKQIGFQKELVTQESERYRLTNQRFAQGLTTVLDLNSVEESLTTAELVLGQQIINWYKAKLRLAIAAGNPMLIHQEVR